VLLIVEWHGGGVKKQKSSPNHGKGTKGSKLIHFRNAKLIELIVMKASHSGSNSSSNNDSSPSLDHSGRTFSVNRLSEYPSYLSSEKIHNYSSNQWNPPQYTTTLKELLTPASNTGILTHLLCASFSTDIKWLLENYIPHHCTTMLILHQANQNSSNQQNTAKRLVTQPLINEWPNLLIVQPTFPKSQRDRGSMHPKLMIAIFKECLNNNNDPTVNLRIIISSANLHQCEQFYTGQVFWHQDFHPIDNSQAVKSLSSNCSNSNITTAQQEENHKLANSMDLEQFFHNQFAATLSNFLLYLLRPLFYNEYKQYFAQQPWMKYLSLFNLTTANVSLICTIPGSQKAMTVEETERMETEIQFVKSELDKEKISHVLGSIRTKLAGLKHCFAESGKTEDVSSGTVNDSDNLQLDFNNSTHVEMSADLFYFLTANNKNIVKQQVFLVRDKSNEFDSNAIAVYFRSRSQGVHRAGYIAAKLAAFLAPLIEAEIISLATAWLYCLSSERKKLLSKQTLIQHANADKLHVSLSFIFCKGKNFNQLYYHCSCSTDLFSSFQSLVRVRYSLYGLDQLRSLLADTKNWPQQEQRALIAQSSSLAFFKNQTFFSFARNFAAACKGKRSIAYSNQQSHSDTANNNNNIHPKSNGRDLCDLKVIYPTVDYVFKAKTARNKDNPMLSEELVSNPYAVAANCLCLARDSRRSYQQFNLMARLEPSELFAERAGIVYHSKIVYRLMQTSIETQLKQGNATATKKLSYKYGFIYVGSHNFSPSAWSSEYRTNYELGVLFIAQRPDLVHSIKNESNSLATNNSSINSLQPSLSINLSFSSNHINAESLSYFNHSPPLLTVNEFSCLPIPFQSDNLADLLYSSQDNAFTVEDYDDYTRHQQQNMKDLDINDLIQHIEESSRSRSKDDNELQNLQQLIKSELYEAVENLDLSNVIMPEGNEFAVKPEGNLWSEGCFTPPHMLEEELISIAIAQSLQTQSNQKQKRSLALLSEEIPPFKRFKGNSLSDAIPISSQDDPEEEKNNTEPNILSSNSINSQNNSDRILPFARTVAAPKFVLELSLNGSEAMGDSASLPSVLSIPIYFNSSLVLGHNFLSPFAYKLSEDKNHILHQQLTNRIAKISRNHAKISVTEDNSAIELQVYHPITCHFNASRQTRQLQSTKNHSVFIQLKHLDSFALLSEVDKSSNNVRYWFQFLIKEL
jgi:hypothetical protein